MDSVFGLVGDGFAIVAADATAGRSILVFLHDQDKVAQLDSHKIMGLAGVSADGVNFSEYIQKNMKLYELNNDMSLSTRAAANFIRGELATALRKGPYQTNPVIAGYDEGKGASMYFCDYLGTLQKVNFCAHGYSGNFLYSIFDREWRAGLTLDEALTILRHCVNELSTRFLIHQPKFVVKVVDAEGVRVLEL